MNVEELLANSSTEVKVVIVNQNGISNTARAKQYRNCRKLFRTKLILLDVNTIAVKISDNISEIWSFDDAFQRRNNYNAGSRRLDHSSLASENTVNIIILPKPVGKTGYHISAAHEATRLQLFFASSTSSRSSRRIFRRDNLDHFVVKC